MPAPLGMYGVTFDFTAYRQAIGSLLYLIVCTPRNAVSTVRKVLQLTEHPTETLLTIIKGVSRYIHGTCWIGTNFVSALSSISSLVGYFDADFHDRSVIRKSISGSVFLASRKAINSHSRSKRWPLVQLQRLGTLVLQRRLKKLFRLPEALNSEYRILCMLTFQKWLTIKLQ